MLLPFAAAIAQEPVASVIVPTPLCDEVMAAIRSGAAPATAAEMVRTAALVKGRDSKCLRDSGAPQPVVRAAVERVQAARAARLAAGGEAEDDDADVTTPGPSSPSPTPSAVPRFDIEFVSFLVAPFKTTGAHWDGFTGGVSQETVTSLAALVGTAAPPAAAVTFATNMANQGIDMPDPFAYAEVFADGQWQPWRQSVVSPTSNSSNTCNVLALSHPILFGLPEGKDVQVRLVVYDEDLAEHDPIASVDLKLDELRTAAAAAGGTAIVNVAERTHNQLLFVTLAVRDSTATQVGGSAIFR